MTASYTPPPWLWWVPKTTAAVVLLAGIEAKSNHTTLAHWQREQAYNTGESVLTSVRISCGLI